MKLYLHTWRCTSCAYVIDCEPTLENLRTLGFERLGITSLTEGECPSCAKAGRHSTMEKVTDTEKMSRVEIADDDQIAAQRVNSGRVDSEGKKIFRSLSAREVTARKAQRDQWITDNSHKIHSQEKT